MKIMRLIFRAGLILLMLLALAIAGVYFVRPGMSDYRAHANPVSNKAADPTALTAAWFGTTALLLSDGSHALMLDPFFTRPQGLLNLALNKEIAPDEALIRNWLKRAGITHLDAVMVSHSHYDHGMDAGVVARLTGAVLLGSESTSNIGRGSGLPEAQIRPIKPGEAMQYGSFNITFIPSKHAGATGGAPTGEITTPLHAPLHYLDYKLGAAYSILIAHPQGSVLHHGSANFVPGALKGYKADLVFLGVSLVDDLDAYLREVVDAVSAKRVIPQHWDDFTRSLDEPLLPLPLAVNLPKFFRQMESRPDLKVQTLQLAQPVVLFEKQNE